MIKPINFNESSIPWKMNIPGNDDIFTEAVFTEGKKSMEPIVKQFQVLKDILDQQISEYNTSLKNSEEGKKKAQIGEPSAIPKVMAFDPEAFWRNTEWKKLEDVMQKQFGLRVVRINPYPEKYIPKKDIFESNELNAFVYRRNRYPIEGLITEKGFYDKSKSVDLDVFMSLGLLRNLSASEVVAILLHEFGHSIDPALCDIKYTGTNLMCKYITDRKGSINKEEKQLIEDVKKNKFSAGAIIGIAVGSIVLIPLLILGIKKLVNVFKSKDARQKEKLEQLQKAMSKDTIEFKRQEYSEAFADNFARMYGFGIEMASALKKLSKDIDTRISRIKKERKREDVIFEITKAAINDVHKTDVHRVKALIKEYYDDINDPNTPAEIKKQLKEDVKEVEIILDQFMNDFSEFQNRINKMINDELNKMDEKRNQETKEKPAE